MSSTSNRCLSVQELIAYGNGQLANHLVVHLTSCELCKAALDGLESIDESTQQALLAGSLMQDYQHVSAATTDSAKIKKLSTSRWAIAASLIVALGWAAIQYYNSADTFSTFETTPLAYVEQPYRRQMRSEGISTDMYGKAASAYAQDSFSRSIALYQESIQKAPTDLLRTRGLYEIGIAYWKLGNFEEAENNLTRARMGELDYYEDSTWALAQLYREMGHLSKALSLYQDLMGIDKSPYAPKAAHMIELIESADVELED